MEIVSGLNKRMCALDQKHASKFNENTENYIKNELHLLILVLSKWSSREKKG